MKTSLNGRIWFVSRKGAISGPHTNEEVEAMMVPLESSELLVWGRGMGQWSTPESWRSQIQQAQLIQTSAREDAWYLSVSGQSQGPLDQETLIEQLRQHRPDQGIPLVRKEGQSRWLEITYLPELMQLAGLEFQSDRIPIMGMVEIHSSGIVASARLHDISERGIGIRGLETMLQAGSYQIRIKSPNLIDVVTTTARLAHVANVAKDGRAGFVFEALPAESRLLIVEYIEKFAKVKKRAMEIGNGSLLEPQK